MCQPNQGTPVLSTPCGLSLQLFASGVSSTRAAVFAGRNFTHSLRLSLHITSQKRLWLLTSWLGELAPELTGSRGSIL